MVQAPPKMNESPKGFLAGINPEYAAQYPDWYKTREMDERRAFTAGWEAFFARYSGLLISHSIRDIRPGFEEAWQAYRGSRNESEPASPDFRKRFAQPPKGPSVEGGLVKLIVEERESSP
jgi:hypothetical protein